MNRILVTDENCPAELGMVDIVTIKLKYRPKIDSFGKYHKCSA